MRIRCEWYVHPLQANSQVHDYKSKRLIDFIVLAEFMEDSLSDGREEFATNDSFQPPGTPPINEQMSLQNEVESEPFQPNVVEDQVSTTRVPGYLGQH